MNNSIYLDLLHNAALLLAIAFIFNITLRKWQFERAILGKILVGILMGVVCIALMATPWVLELGIIFDTRSVLLCISGLFFGAIPTIITMVIAIIYRIVISGTAAVTGVSVILASGLIGLAWRYFRKTPLVNIKNWELYLIGIIVHIVMLALMLLMPYEKAIEVLEHISLPVLIIYPIATVLLGILIRNQLNEEIIYNRILQSEENLSITLHSISDAVVSTDENGNVVMMNPAAEKILGYKMEEAKGNKFCNYFKIYNETTKDDIQCPVAQVLASGEIVGLSNHTILVSKDGKEYNISDGAAPIKDIFGNVKGVVIVFSDVTESHKARKNLTESEKRFRSYIDNAPDGVFIADNQGNLININNSAAIMSGYSLEELIKLNIRDIVYEEDLDIGLKHFQRILEKGEATGDFRFKLKDGSIRSWSVKAVKITDNTILGFASDITEEIILKEKLKASDRVFNFSVDMLCTANYDGFFTHLNPAWEKTLGWDLQTLLSKPYKEFIHPDDIYGKTIDEIDLLNYSIRFLCKDRTYKWLSWNIYPYPDERVIFAVARDITKLKENEKALIESEKKYRTLFENMNEAFALHEIILDENNEPVDYRFIEINSVFEEISGVKKEDLIGKRASEALSNIVDTRVNIFKEVAFTGKSINLINHSKTLNKYYNIKAFCPQKGYFAITFTDITEQKLAELAIKDSEERYRSLFENNHAVMLIIDPKNGEIIDANPAAVKFYRWSKEELLQKKISEINILGEKEVQNEMSLAQQEKRNCFIFKHLIADGSLRDVEVYSGPIVINERPLLYSVIHDITERKKTEESLRESEERYNRFINSNTDIIFVKDDSLRYIVANDAYCNFLKKERKDILLKTDYQLMQRAEADKCKDSDKLALSTGKTVVVEELVANQTFEVTKFPIKLKAAKVGLGAIIRNITEKKQVIEKVRKSEKRFQSLVENAFDGIYLIRDKNYEFVNERFCEITGYTREELLSVQFDFNVLLTEKSKELMRKRYEARYSHQEVSNLYEIEIISKNNELKIIEVSTVVLEEKELLLVLGIMRDITERKQTELRIIEDNFRQQKFNTYIAELIKDGEFVSGKFSDNLRKIVKTASVMLDTERVSIWIYNQNYTEMYCKTLYEKSKDSFSKGLKLFTKEFPNYVEEHKSGRIIAVENVYEDPITNQIPSSYFIEKDTKSLLDAPVWTQGRLAAILCFENTGQHRKWLPDEIQLSLTLASLISLCLETHQRKQIEEALRDSEELHRKLIMTVPDIIIRTDINGHITFINETSFPLFNMLPIERVYGKNIFDFIADEDKERAIENAKKMIDKPQGIIEYKLRFEDGFELICEVNGDVIHDINNQPVGMVFVIRDISEKKKTEEQIYLKSLVINQIQDKVTITDLNGIIIDINKAELELLGYNKDEIIGSHVNLFGDDIQKGASQNEILENTLKYGHWRGEVVNYNKQGEEIILDCRITKIFDLNNNPIALCGISTDITQQKKNEEELRQKNEFIQTVLDNLPIGIAINSISNNQVFYFNHKFEEINGWNKEILSDIDKFYMNAIPDEKYRSEIRTRIANDMKSLDENRMHWENLKIHTKNGDIKFINVANIPLAEQDSMVSTVIDITKQKRAEEALEKRIIALTQPINDSIDITFEDLFNIKEIQKLQDDFANATGVASLITYPDGSSITQPSNFCPLCKDIIRKTDKGLENCIKSDAESGVISLDGPRIQPCLSGGLWEAGAGISVGGKHIANWLIGQVRDETQTDENMAKYAEYIGVDKNLFLEAFHKVPVMSKEEFEKISQVLFTLANQLSNIAYQNVQQARFITQMEKYDEVLRNEKYFSDKLIESLPGLFFMFDSNMQIIRCNKNNERFVGLDSDTIRAHNIFNSIYDDDKQLLQDSIKIALEKGEAQGIVRLIRKDGEICSYHIIGKRLDTNEGTLLMGVGIDFSDRIKMENELLIAKDKAEQSDKLKTSFLQNMSHEIRTPLNGIVGFSNLLQDFNELTDDERNEYIELIISSSKRLLAIVNDVLEISRLDSGLAKVNISNFSLDEMFHYINSLYSETIKEKGINFISNLPFELSKLYLITDKDKLYQIIINLLNNAIKFTKQGEIELAFKIEEDMLIISVRDTGIGINEEYIDKVFERFWQYEAFSNAKFGGTGLGLSICKETAKLLDFDLSVDSELNVGSIFSLSIPLFYVKGGNIMPKNSEEKKEKIRLPQMKILIVEDENTNYFYLKQLLKNENVQITLVKTGFDAIKKVEEEKFDLVLMDLKMPLLSGFEATKIIKNSNPNIPIIAQTAYSHLDEKQEALDAGCDAFISKPIEKNELFSIIMSVIGKNKESSQ